ncbi:VOC family protein [Nocardioides sp. GY 10113]|uniref:VOC family protein n=1 Tax=Nocardioides sp. GY 10113 TaxID=2569761 RepID=UPI0010A88120|nr:VOC family protein [Nocardioides sp. GY 10113]TIC87427.1 VOC family protein [Nocardioides sp. GY 10113]
MTTTPGAPCWIELTTSDRDKAVAFYGELFGWTATEPAEQFGGYSQFELDGRPIGGMMPEIPGMTGAPGWFVYLAVEDAEKIAESATAAGGAVAVPPMPLPDLGSMVVVTDASGLAHGGWQPAPFSGFQSVDGAGDPVWFETYSKDFATTRTFLQEVFGWETVMAGDTDEFRYATNGEPESATAGLMDASGWGDDFVPTWTTYIKVADMAATLEKVADLGGSVLQGPDDTPYGVLATIADPNGQSLKVIVPPVR